MAYIYDLSDAWNAAGTTFTAIKMNVTDTASAAASMLMDLQVGGVSRFNVTKAGTLAAQAGSAAAPGYGIGTTGLGIYSRASVRINFATSGSDTGIEIGGNLLALAAPASVAWVSGTLASSGIDLFLLRDAANTLGQRHNVNAQAFNLYNTYTDASNYERGFMRWSANQLNIGTEAAGTGVAARSLSISSGSITSLNAVGSIRFNMSGVAGPFFLQSNQVRIANFGLTFCNDNNYNGPEFTILRDAANTLGQRSGTAAQTSRLYGTYTDASNYRRLTKTMSTAGVAEIKPEGAGTGASGNVLHISGLPTSNPGPGILWNNAGTPAIGT